MGVADWAKWAERYFRDPENRQRAGENSAQFVRRVNDEFYGQLETTQERLQHGHSSDPDFNVGVYFDDRNDPDQQPDWIPGRGNTGKPIPMW